MGGRDPDGSAGGAGGKAPRGIDREIYAPADGVRHGAYVLNPQEADPELILIGTGSELPLVVSAHERLASEGIRSVSGAPDREEMANSLCRLLVGPVDSRRLYQRDQSQWR